MSFRSWATILTLILLSVVVYFGWPHIEKAWALMGGVNPWIFVLILPLQVFSYYTIGEVTFSYLRQKGDLKGVSRWKMTRIALETNFVDHIVPVPAAAGFSFLGWRLHHLGVRTSRSTMAQLIRYLLIFVSFVSLVFISVIVLFFDHKVNKIMVFMSLAFLVFAIVIITLLVYVIKNKNRLLAIARFLTLFLNKVIKFATFGKKQNVIGLVRIRDFLFEIHQDYVEIRHDKKLLAKSAVWAVLTNVLDVSLFFIAFLSLGYWLNPAALFISFGLASVVTIFAVTPGGTGVYEAVMIALLASFGIPAEIAIAGTLLARAILLVFTIFFGYIFYQLTINKYGKVS